MLYSLGQAFKAGLSVVALWSPSVVVMVGMLKLNERQYAQKSLVESNDRRIHRPQTSA
jgi:hypothetical protein